MSEFQSTYMGRPPRRTPLQELAAIERRWLNKPLSEVGRAEITHEIQDVLARARARGAEIPDCKIQLVGCTVNLGLALCSVAELERIGRERGR